MKPIYWWILLVVGVTAPTVLFSVGMPDWGRGALLGECLGWLSYIWVGFSVRRFLTKEAAPIHRKLFVHTFLRYLVIGGVLFLSVKTPGIHLVGVVIGYSIIQLPSATFRALSM